MADTNQAGAPATTGTPTKYTLNYDDPCTSEDNGCDGGDCGTKTQFTARPTVFCREITGNSSLTIAGAATIRGNATLATANIQSAVITVGGQAFRPTVINTISGPHLVLAVF